MGLKSSGKLVGSISTKFRPKRTILGPLRAKFHFVWEILGQQMVPQVAPQAKVPMQKGSYIDPLVMMESPNFEVFVDICHQTLSFC